MHRSAEGTQKASGEMEEEERGRVFQEPGNAIWHQDQAISTAQPRNQLASRHENFEPCRGCLSVSSAADALLSTDFCLQSKTGPC